MGIPANFSALNTRDDIVARWYIEIEGLRRRYGTWSPAWNPADTGTNRPIVDSIAGLPSLDGPKTKPLNGSTDPYGFSIELVDLDDELTDALADHHADTITTLLTAAVADAAVTTITVADSSVFSVPCDIYVDRETMRATAAPTGATLTVTRGMYGSTAIKHLLVDEYGGERSALVSNRPRFILTRKCILYETRSGLAEVDGIKMRGIIESIAEDEGVYTIECVGHLRGLQRTICMGLKTGTLIASLCGSFLNESVIEGLLMEREVSGGHGYRTTWAAFVNADAGFPTTGSAIIDDELISWDHAYDMEDLVTPGHPTGQVLVIDKPYYDGLSAPDRGYYGTMFRVAYAEFAELPNRGRFFHEIYGTKMPGTIFGFGSFDRPNLWSQPHMSGVQIRQAITHEDFQIVSDLTDPISVLLCILLSKEGDGANHATYDILPPGVGLGIPAAEIDVAGMLALRRSTGLNEHKLKFVIQEPVEAKDWLETNILRPCHLFFVERWDGTIGLSRLYTKEEAEIVGSTMTIDESVMLSLPKYDHGGAPFGKFTILCNRHPVSGDHMGSAVVKLSDALTLFDGVAKVFEIECGTLYDYQLTNGRVFTPDSFADLSPWVAQYIGPIWQRWGVVATPKISVEVAYNRMTDLHVGSLVKLTASTIPNPATGARGYTNVWCQVMGVDPQPEQSSIRLDLWMIDVHTSSYRRIAPAAKVTAFNAGTFVVTVAANEFSEAGVTTDAASFAVGDEVRFVDPTMVDLTVGGDEVPIIAINGNDIEVDEPSDYPGAGDYMITAGYAGSVAAQKAAWAYQADSAKKLGVANDDGHKRL